ncbi:hypothetical protein [Thalassospira lucentensis]|uniref:hypothetical protein n=1 Tax=Thalassospira lucentensis TaxID=168935 RepID=UPI003AA82493
MEAIAESAVLFGLVSALYLGFCLSVLLADILPDLLGGEDAFDCILIAENKLFVLNRQW